MKNLYILICLVALNLTASSQSINLFKIDTTKYPILSAKYLALDANNIPVKPNINDLKLTENGILRKIIGVNCPPTTPPNAISSVLVLDVSGSMSYLGNGIERIEMAKIAAKSWVRALPQGNSECAITSFDNNNYLNRDYTNDTTKLISAIEKIQPQSGTDYMAALIRPLAGGLEITKLAKYQKLIVFITDGQPNFEPDVNAIIAEAKSQNCIIVAVTLNMPAPNCIREITKATGGDYYENITTLQEAQAVYNTILQKSLGTDFCDLTWESEPICQGGIIDLELTWNNTKVNSNYTLPEKGIAELATNTNYINFGIVEENTTKDTTITIIAKNGDFNISDIQIKYGGSEFEIVGVTYPFTLKNGESKNITVRCMPIDSNLYYSSFEIVTDKCTGYFSTSCGVPSRQMSRPTLVITKPDGKEALVSGGSVEITWKGVSPKDTVNLEYSLDSGTTWLLITKDATGLKYLWDRLPKTSNKNILFKISQNNNNDISYIFKDSSRINAVAISPSGDYIATAASGKLRIWSVANKYQIFSQTVPNEVTKLEFSKNGSKLYGGISGNSKITVWETNNFKVIDTIPSFTFAISGNGDYLVTISSTSSTNTSNYNSEINLWQLKNKTLVKSWVLDDTYSNLIAMNYDGNKIAVRSINGQIVIIDKIRNTITRNLLLHSNLNSLAFNNIGSQLACGSNNKLEIWDLPTFNPQSFPIIVKEEHQNNITKVIYSQDNFKIITASLDNTSKIFNALDGKLLKSLVFLHLKLMTLLLVQMAAK